MLHACNVVLIHVSIALFIEERELVIHYIYMYVCRHSLFLYNHVVVRWDSTSTRNNSTHLTLDI